MGGGQRPRRNLDLYVAIRAVCGDAEEFSDLGRTSARHSPIPIRYAIVEQRRIDALGITTLMEIKPAMRVVEVGHIVYSPALQRTPLGTEAQYLLARHAFETLRYRRYEWKCNALNAASRRAALRYGFTFEGILRQHMIAKGRNRDTAYFSILDSDWPIRKANFERWLSPDNFTADGRQNLSLSALNDIAEMNAPVQRSARFVAAATIRAVLAGAACLDHGLPDAGPHDRLADLRNHQ